MKPLIDMSDEEFNAEQIRHWNLNTNPTLSSMNASYISPNVTLGALLPFELIKSAIMVYAYNQDYPDNEEWRQWYPAMTNLQSPEMGADNAESKEEAEENAKKLLQASHGSLWKDSNWIIPKSTVDGTPNSDENDPDASEKLGPLKIPRFPKDNEYRSWTMSFFQAINCATRHPVAALAWLRRGLGSRLRRFVRDAGDFSARLRGVGGPVLAVLRRRRHVFCCPALFFYPHDRHHVDHPMGARA